MTQTTLEPELASQLFDSATQLQVAVGSFSIAGIKSQNEDCVGFLCPEDTHQLSRKGIAVAIADGVSSAEAGKEASFTAVNNFIQDYYQTLIKQRAT
jgi:protein phosphatase